MTGTNFIRKRNNSLKMGYIFELLLLLKLEREIRLTKVLDIGKHLRVFMYIGHRNLKFVAIFRVVSLKNKC